MAGATLPTIAGPVAAALADGRPVVALETALVTHGLPAPTNLDTAADLEATVRAGGAVPATIGALDGALIVGLAPAEVARLAAAPDAVKASVRDLPAVVARGRSAGTTVAATAWLAHRAGIEVFVTGGIGGVHRGAGVSLDISADLPVLASTPLVVVCAGAKTVLDLPATLEWLETAGVLVVGYGVDRLPGFFVRDTGLPLPARADSAAEVAALARAGRALGRASALLVVVPPPEEVALPAAAVAGWLDEALAEQAGAAVRGGDVTPFLLRRLLERSGGATLRANVALLRENARVGAAVARAMRA